MKTKAERLEAVKSVCDAWSNVIDRIMDYVTEIADEYNDARTKGHNVFVDVLIR